MRDAPLRREISRLYRAHFAAVVAPLIPLVGFEAAEDSAQHAFIQATHHWSESGVPGVPLSWLRRTAKNRAIDELRRRKRWNVEPQNGSESNSTEFATDRLTTDETDVLQDGLDGDDTLRLMFMCTHPALNEDVRLALTLRHVVGLTSEEVARALLLKHTTLQQRLVRARKKIDGAKIPFEVPPPTALESRLDAVLHVVYLIFNEGHSASHGQALVRSRLCEEALRLSRLLTQLLPANPSPKALLALLMLHHSRRATRQNNAGDLITLDKQDRSAWDWHLIDAALPLVDEVLKARPVPRYAVEAAIAALHAQADSSAETDWKQITRLYAVLLDQNPNNLVAALNGAVAMAMGGEIGAALCALKTLESRNELRAYMPLFVALAEVNHMLGAERESEAYFRRAIELSKNDVERRFLTTRHHELFEAEL